MNIEVINNGEDEDFKRIYDDNGNMLCRCMKLTNKTEFDIALNTVDYKIDKFYKIEDASPNFIAVDSIPKCKFCKFIHLYSNMIRLKYFETKDDYYDWIEEEYLVKIVR